MPAASSRRSPEPSEFRLAMRFSPHRGARVCETPPRREPRRLNFVADVERQAGIDVGLKVTDPDILVVVDACE